jgi:PhnB protein
MAVAPVPPGFHTVTPHLVFRGAGKAIEFYKKAFGATEVMIMPGPDGKGVMHGEIKIGDSIIFLADEFPGYPLAAPEKFGGTTVSIHLYVPNADAVFNQAVAAGAKVEMPMMDMFWTKR